MGAATATNGEGNSCHHAKTDTNEHELHRAGDLVSSLRRFRVGLGEAVISLNHVLVDNDAFGFWGLAQLSEIVSAWKPLLPIGRLSGK
jgi:hypothetical protein